MNIMADMEIKRREFANGDLFASFSNRKYVVRILFRVRSLSDYILKIDLLSLDCYL
jgi:hypothetical protein